MKTINLDMKQHAVNRINITIPGQSMGGNIEISFFEPGKFGCAYAEISSSINYDNNNLEHNFSGLDGKITLQLPNCFLYDLKIRGDNTWCTIRNGTLHFADIETLRVRLENINSVSDTPAIHISSMPDSNIILINSHVHSITGKIENLYAYASNIDHLFCGSILYRINILNTKIDNLTLHIPNLSDLSTFDATNSEIKNMSVRDTNVNLDNCRIQNIICKDSTINLNYCTYSEPGYINSKDSILNIENKEEYCTKKRFPNKIYLCDKTSKKKLIKVLNK